MGAPSLDQIEEFIIKLVRNLILPHDTCTIPSGESLALNLKEERVEDVT